MDYNSPIKIRLIKISGLDRAFVILTGSGGEASCEFPLVWDDSQRWIAVFCSLELYCQDRRTWPKKKNIVEEAEKLGFFERGKPSYERLRIMGSELYRMIFGSEEIGSLFNRLLLKEQQDNESPVVQIHIFDEGSKLQAYPWELLYDEKNKNFLFESRRAILVRYIDFDQPIPVIELNEALRVLVIDPRPDSLPDGYEPLPSTDRSYLKTLADAEAAKFAVVNLDDLSMSGGTLAKLDSYLASDENPHILHIDTHGEFGWLCKCDMLNSSGAKKCKKCNTPRLPDQKSQGYLLFQSSKGASTWISADQLAAQVYRRNIQLVVLSACKSALVGGSSSFNSIAGALIKNGIPAAIAMQFSIDTQTSEVFVKKFYPALILKKPLTDAVAEVRSGLLANELKDSWYRPVLYLRTDPSNYRGQIFKAENDILDELRDWKRIHNDSQLIVRLLSKPLSYMKIYDSSDKEPVLLRTVRNEWRDSCSEIKSIPKKWNFQQAHTNELDILKKEISPRHLGRIMKQLRNEDICDEDFEKILAKVTDIHNSSWRLLHIADKKIKELIEQL